MGIVGKDRLRRRRDNLEKAFGDLVVKKNKKELEMKSTSKTRKITKSEDTAPPSLKGGGAEGGIFKKLYFIHKQKKKLLN